MEYIFEWIVSVLAGLVTSELIYFRCFVLKEYHPEMFKIYWFPAKLLSLIPGFGVGIFAWMIINTARDHLKPVLIGFGILILIVGLFYLNYKLGLRYIKKRSKRR